MKEFKQMSSEFYSELSAAGAFAHARLIIP